MSSISAVHAKHNPVHAVAPQQPHATPTQATPSGSSNQDSVTISSAGIQASQGQAPDAAQAQSATPTYPTYQAHPSKAK